MKERLVSFGIDLSAIESKADLTSAIELSKSPEQTYEEVSAKIILDLKDRIERLTDYISKQDDTDLKDKIKKLMRAIKDIKKYAESKEEEFIEAFSVFK